MPSIGGVNQAVATTLFGALFLIALTNAFRHILHGEIQQHREWMIRSYVVTFGFVIFRAVVEVFEIAGTGTTVERLTAASWMCWAVPLLIAEMMLQGRKIFMYGVQVPERLAARESGLLELMKSTENTVVSRPQAPSKVRLEQPQSVVESNL